MPKNISTDDLPIGQEGIAAVDLPPREFQGHGPPPNAVGGRLPRPIGNIPIPAVGTQVDNSLRGDLDVH